VAWEAYGKLWKAEVLWHLSRCGATFSKEVPTLGDFFKRSADKRHRQSKQILMSF